MPKLVLRQLLLNIREDIASHFPIGSRYRTIREIGVHFGVSLQTAQRAVQELAGQQVLITRPRSGIRVLSHDTASLLAGKTILVISALGDPRLADAFLQGIREAVGPWKTEVFFFPVNGQKHETLQFAEVLQEEYKKRNAAGLIALGFRNSALPFYHLMNSGHLVVCDVMSHQLPGLPSVQPDNRHHAAKAAQEFARKGKTNILVVGYWTMGNTRHTAFEEAFLATAPGGRCKYVHLADDLSTVDLDIFFRHFSTHDAVFSVDTAANQTVALYFASHHVSPANNLIVFDCEYEGYTYAGLPPIRAAAPCLSALGRRLAEKLIDRIRTGHWKDPINELV
jgi:DNA-binding LacI/PurR family transcriptional regulator